MGLKLGAHTGIMQLMDDLGEGLAEGAEVAMLGGGNPALIPEVEAVWHRSMQELIDTPSRLNRMLGIYDSPRGNPAFIQTFSGLLKDQFGWEVHPDELAVTNGGQTAFFYLFNLLAGKQRDRKRQILLPLAPEYIGYADQGLEQNMFRAQCPRIEERSAHRFKYHVDFDRLELNEKIAAVALSRPTNPSGNLVSDSELERLAGMTEERDIPLLIDHAYGIPFPGVVYKLCKPIQRAHLVHSFSLSKLGLPGTRTAIIHGPAALIRALVSMNAVVGLANTNLGQTLVEPLLRSGEIIRLCRSVIQPFYQKRSLFAQKLIEAHMPDSVDYSIHESEGAFFLWIWFRNLRISTQELYLRCKEKGLIIVPGEPFFYGLEDPNWAHQSQCIRLSFATSETTLERGIKILSSTCAEWTH